MEFRKMEDWMRERERDGERILDCVWTDLHSEVK